jgi:hypothetical protein
MLTILEKINLHAPCSILHPPSSCIKSLYRITETLIVRTVFIVLILKK